jgi:hypothetical protein
MVKSLRNAGDFNLRGKKTHLASCKCCTVEDFRDRELEKEHLKEMKSAKDQDTK